MNSPTHRTPGGRPSSFLLIPEGMAEGLRNELAPRTTLEHVLVRQLIWAAAQLMAMTTDAPAQPDAPWLRLYNSADRTFHRNLRELRRLRARASQPSSSSPNTLAPAPSASPSPSPAQAVAPKAPPTVPNPQTTNKRPGLASRPIPDRRRPAPRPVDPFQRLAALLDDSPTLAESLPISISPSPPQAAAS